jgi:hypothetical protein
MRTAVPMRTHLPDLPLSEWEPTKNTLHLWVQIVGKIRLAAAPPCNHWWNAPLYVDVRGLTTRRMHANGVSFEIDFDFIDHALVVRTHRGESVPLPLRDDLSVAEFDASLHAILTDLRIDVEIREQPFGMPITTPFRSDREHASYDAEYVTRFWRILDWSDGVFTQFAGWFAGKTSPVHLFWHGLDLAVTRFSGRRAPPMPEVDSVSREAYSHEVISFGFWPGDQKVREPAYYSYTAPEPEGLRSRLLQPGAAYWQQDGALAILPYDVVRTADDPRRTLLAFVQSAYDAGSIAAGWDRDGLTSSWCPTVQELTELVRG